MKKVLSILFLTVTFIATAAAQTTNTMLVEKIDNAPANEYGVKRLNYGVWDTGTGATNIWAYYAPDEGYVVCKVEKGQLSHKKVADKSTETKTEEANKILEEADPECWIAIQW